MDPNAALAAIRAHLVGLTQATDDDDFHYTVEALAEHVQALDGWITSGGFLPDAWNRNAPSFGRTG